MSHSPLPLRPKYWTRAEDRQEAVNALFDRSARFYDRTNEIMSLGSGRGYRRAALTRAGLKSGMTVLDVGIGTGLVAREAVDLVGGSGGVTGIDPSIAMMTAGGALAPIKLVQALGEALPFADACFDFVTMGYALRHVPDLDRTFAGYARVLKPGGRVLLLEITSPRSVIGRTLARTYFGAIVPWCARLGTGSAEAQRLMQFYWDTIAHCVPPEVILTALRQAGFAATRTVSVGVFSEYLGTRAV